MAEFLTTNVNDKSGTCNLLLSKVFETKGKLRYELGAN